MSNNHFFRIVFILLMAFSSTLWSKQTQFTVAMNPNYMPFTYEDKDGHAQGFYVDLWRLWAEKNSYSLSFVSSDWVQSIDNAVNKKVDFHASLYYPETGLILAKEIHIDKVSLFIPKKCDIKSPADLSKKKIGVIEPKFGEVFKKKYPAIEIVPVENYEQLFSKVLNGQLDALYDTKLAVQNELIEIQQVHLFKTCTLDTEITVLAQPASHDQKLIDIFESGWKNITYSELVEIENRWIYNEQDRTYKPDASLNLTPEEQQWISTHTVRVGGEFDWPPFDFVKDDEYQGISKEIIDLVAQKTGLKIEYVTGQSWKELLEDFKHGKLDVLPALYLTEERETYTKFTQPYLKIKDYIFARSNDASIKSIHALADKKVAVIDGYAVIDNLKRQYPDIDLLRVKSLEDGIDAVLLKKADLYIEAYPTMMYTLTQTMQSGIKPVLPLDFYSNDLHIGINKSKPLLASVITKGLDAVTLEEKNRVFKKWMAVDEHKRSINFTEDERKWLQQHPVIKVANEMDWPPFDYNEFDTPKGLSIDLISLVAEKIGLKVEFVNGYSWSQLLELFKQKKIDVMPAIYRNSEREQFIRFTPPYYKGKLAIFSREKDSTIQSYKDLAGKIVGMQSNDGSIPIVLKQLPSITLVELENNNKLVQALATKKVDAIIGNPLLFSYFAKENQITDLHLVDYLTMEQSQQAQTSLHIGMQRENVMLHGLIEKAMSSISHDEMKALEEKWTLSTQSRVVLTPKEEAWIQKHPVITYSEVNWKPLSIIENGSMKGILGDYLDIVSKETGIAFKFIPSASWPDVLEKFKNGKIDLVPGIGDSQEELVLGSISEKYAEYPMAIITNEKITYVKSLKSIRDKTFSIPKHYTSYNYLKSKYPDVQIIETDSISEALKNVADGRADVFIGHLAPALYYIAKLGRENLKIAGNTDFSFKHHFLISPQYPELVSIVNKVFDVITEKEREQIYHTWVHTEVKQSFDYTILWKIGGGIAILIIFFGYYNHKIQQQKDFVQTLLNSQEQIIISTDGETIKSANRAFLKFYAVDSIELFIKKYNAECICDTFNTEAPEGYLQKVMSEEQWIDYVINRPHHTTHKAMITQNGTDFIYSVSAAILPGNKGWKVAVFTDVTAIENAKEEIEKIHQQTKESIEYAALTQGALIPESTLFRKFFRDHFTLWQPRDIVGGDIYLAEQISEDEIVVMVIDCTGHGVPGAFVTMLVKAVERQILANVGVKDNGMSPAKMLNVFNRSIKHLLHQESADSLSNAGFDAGIIHYNKKEKKLRFAGAEIALYMVEEGNIKVIRGNRQSIAYKKSDIDYEFTDHEFEVSEQTRLYITTDGFIDQNGGEKGFPFGKKRFKQLLKTNHSLPFEEQKNLLLEALKEYQGTNETNDDITIIGIKL